MDNEDDPITTADGLNLAADSLFLIAKVIKTIKVIFVWVFLFCGGSYGVPQNSYLGVRGELVEP